MRADADGTTPLDWAVYNDDLPTAQRLLHAGAERQERQSLWRDAALAGGNQPERGHGRSTA